MAASCLSRVMSAMTMKPRFVTDNAKGMLASPVLTVLGSLIVKGNVVISYRRELLHVSFNLCGTVQFVTSLG